MAVLQPGSTLRVERAAAINAEEGWRLVADGDDLGRFQGNELVFGDLTLRLQATGERFEMVTGTGTPVLRFDPAGRKATTLTTSSARYRLARQRPVPLVRKWLLTRDVHGATVLTVSQTPLGTKVELADDTEVAPGELALLALGALVEVLDLEAAAVTF